VTLFAVGALPFKVRILRAYARIASAVSSSTVSLYSRAAGAGTLLGVLSSASTGLKTDDGQTATTVLTPASNVGIYARRSDRAAAGEIFIEWRRES